MKRLTPGSPPFREGSPSGAGGVATSFGFDASWPKEPYPTGVCGYLDDRVRKTRSLTRSRWIRRLY